MHRLSGLTIAVLLAASPAFASSDEAWDEFAKEVEAKCLNTAAPNLENAKIAVDPFGSERFGLAILTGKAKGADAIVSYICVMDKQAGTVELGSELTADVVGVTVP
ncbi:hypothetical protein [Ciceribacter sp. L1K22]|uniref:hypothetical protein n=1 Tax=Ciceribacter sp. L1K22 TaxID=2820275 RepID=UPI001ABDA86A|nr:hypothetical protein [Ciceribacter sp. L1K22]MBO3759292.1 hypothetical protein [Ciceribacter sp. L1K22]